MSDPAGLPHPLGIEAVDWSAGTGSDLVVRVAGRWRRRRSFAAVPPVLALDTEHQRYRFPALPEPPSVRGAQAGLWQVSFMVPASLAPYLAGRLTLMLGSVSISLPPAVADPGGPSLTEEPGDPSVAAAIRTLADPAVMADRCQRHVREESERLQRELKLSERKRREAEQLAHAERAIRLDLGRDHAVRVRRHQSDARAVLELLEAAQTHAHDLGREIETLRRSAEEEHEPPPSDVDAHPSGPGRPGRSRGLAAELAISRSTPPAPVAAVMPTRREPPGLRLELAMQAARNAPPSASSAGAGGAGATAAAEPRLAGALLRLAAERADAEDLIAPGTDQDRSRVAYVTEAIEAIARQIDAVRSVVTLLPPVAAEALGSGQPPSAQRSQAPAGAASVVAPERLAAALYRLRRESAPPESETSAPPGVAGRTALPSSLALDLAAARDPVPSAARPPTSRWLLRALKGLLREDPTVVGTLIIRLLPAQCLVLAGPVSYDIALTRAACLTVTVRDDRVRLDVLSAPRPLDEVDFRIEGDLGGLGRLVLYGRLRRRISRRVARVRGDRRGFAALDWLIREPLGLRELYAAGLRLDPELTLRLVAHMIEPSWTAGERFSVGHESPGGKGRVYLLVRDGERPRVSREAPLGPVDTTIRCPDEQLLSLLAAESGVEIRARGATAPIALLRGWIARAQRDS